MIGKCMKCGKEYQLSSNFFFKKFECECGGYLSRYEASKKPKTRKIESEDLIIAILVTWNICILLSFIFGFLVFLFGISASLFLYFMYIDDKSSRRVRKNRHRPDYYG